MKNSMLGIIDATISFSSLEPISNNRSLAAMPIGGRYRLIDFMLSNMVNSDITCVGVFPRSESRSLMDHLNSGKEWDLDRKRDGMFLLTPRCEEDELGTFKHFKGHIDFLLRAKNKYVCVVPANIVTSMDLRLVLKRHIKVGAQITEVMYDGKSLEIYVLERKQLIEMIQNGNESFSLRDIVALEKEQNQVHQYEFDGYVSVIKSLHNYYQTNLTLMNPEQWKRLFRPEFPMYTKVKDEPPTRYRKEASVKSSIVANGGVVEGTVENSVLFRSVKVGKGTIIRNSIIMQKCQIGDNCVLDGVILDKDVKIADGQQLITSESGPIVLQKGTILEEMVRK